MKPIILNEQTLPGPIPDNFTHDRDYDQTVTGGENPILEKQLHGFLQMQRTALDNTSPAPNPNLALKE